jgi:hypothetical protein
MEEIIVPKPPFISKAIFVRWLCIKYGLVGKVRKIRGTDNYTVEVLKCR